MRSEVKKVDKRPIGKTAKTERPKVKAIRKSKSEKLVCRYCGSDDLAPSFIKRRDRRCRKCFSKRYGSAADRGRRRRRSRSRFAQLDERGRARKRARPLCIFRKIVLPIPTPPTGTKPQDSAFRFSTNSVCYCDRRRVVSTPLDDTCYAVAPAPEGFSNGQGMVD